MILAKLTRSPNSTQRNNLNGHQLLQDSAVGKAFLQAYSPPKDEILEGSKTPQYMLKSSGSSYVKGAQTEWLQCMLEDFFCE